MEHLKKLIYWYRSICLQKKWRSKRKRKGTIRLYVRDVAQLFRRFEEYNIRYLVLRWFQEVPTTVEQEKDHANDVDLLIEVEGNLPTIAQIVSRQPGHFKCDLYSTSGRFGTSYLGMPYYPPVLAQQLLDTRIRHETGFYIPSRKNQFLSLAYHLTYHKGLESGIPSGCELTANPHPKRPYGQLLEKLGKELGVDLPTPYTLLGLHNYLKQNDWDMPYDLLERWPRRTDWHKKLLEVELGIIDEDARRLPHILVFFIREDMVKEKKEDFILNLIREKFRILEMVNLSEEQSNRVMRQVRGGNWLKYKGTETIGPAIAVCCHDDHPIPIDKSDTKRNALYPLVSNQNAFHKHEIRKRLAEESGSEDRVNGIHGSDNAYESQHMLRAIFGQEHIGAMNRQLLEKIKNNFSL